MIRAKALAIVALLWLAALYLAIAIYGRYQNIGTNAWYSEDVDATCVVERRFDQMAISCLPGNRIKKESRNDHDQ